MKLINTFTIFSLLFAVIAPTVQAVEEKTDVTEQGVPAQPAEEKKSGSLMELSLEDLMNIQVTTLSKGAEGFFKTPAAITVITQDDIQRSGMNSLADLFRMVPGMHSAHIDGSVWAVSARGFNGFLANKLLVLIDGRSIYNTFFSGVLWGIWELPLEDIERIEIIRGPGGTLWGTNAVNGIVNIITKNAKDTHGGLLAASSGYTEFGAATLRYGGQSGDNFHYRVFGKYFYRDDFSTPPNGVEANDYWQMGRTGFRIDWEIAANDVLTFTGDSYFGRNSQTVGDFDFNNPAFVFLNAGTNPQYGGSILGKWTHTLSEHSNVEVQLSYARDYFKIPTVASTEDGLHIDALHRFKWGKRQNFTWGAGYRFLHDDTESGQQQVQDPDNFTQHLFTGFFQDEITLSEDRLTFTAGVKLEHNAFSGFEYQPSGRLMWTPHHRHGFWAAVTRAVKTPSRLQEDVLFRTFAFVDPATGTPVVFAGRGGDVTSEKVISGEWGYRVQPADWLNLDLATFINHYDDLFSQGDTQITTFQTDPVPHVEIASPFGNNMFGWTYGIELATDLELAKWWRIRTGFSWLEVNLDSDSAAIQSGDVLRLEENDPRILASIRSQIDLPHNLEFDTGFYFASDIGETNQFGNQLGVEEVYRLDAQLSWKTNDHLRLSLVGQNLLQSQESEYNDFFSNFAPTDVPRTFYGKVAWEF